MYGTIATALLAATAIAAGGSDYDYKQNGADWGTIHDGKYALCDSGVEQSPIDLTGAEGNDMMNLIGYNYYDWSLPSVTPAADSPAMTVGFMDESQRLQSELQITFPDGSKSFFTPKQFHFHAPSEHSVDGKLYDAEVHFVHVIKGSGENVNGEQVDERYGAVIGVFFDRELGGNRDNPFLTSFFDARDSSCNGDEDCDTSEETKIALRQFLGTIDFTEYWSYDGSFTTPPCTEGIKWSVIKQVQPISDAQLKKFTENMADKDSFAGGKGNNRVVQSLEQRTLSYSGAVNMLAATAAAFTAIAALSF